MKREREREKEEEEDNESKVCIGRKQADVTAIASKNNIMTTDNDIEIKTQIVSRLTGSEVHVHKITIAKSCVITTIKMQIDAAP